jgi:hypothetical protein
MKRHLFTAALAIVALGGAVASTANSTTSKSSLTDVYYSGVSCSTQTSCLETNNGTVCSEASGQFYSAPGCNPADQIPAPSGKLPIVE